MLTPAKPRSQAKSPSKPLSVRHNSVDPSGATSRSRRSVLQCDGSRRPAYVEAVRICPAEAWNQYQSTSAFDDTVPDVATPARIGFACCGVSFGSTSLPVKGESSGALALAAFVAAATSE